jgi:hypothetical protein
MNVKEVTKEGLHDENISGRNVKRRSQSALFKHHTASRNGIPLMLRPTSIYIFPQALALSATIATPAKP